MKIVQFKVDDNYLNIVLTLLNNLKIDIIKDLSIFKEQKKDLKFDKDETLTKFVAVDNSLKNSDKAQDFLQLGGSNCWNGDLNETREDRVEYGSR